MWSSPQRAQSKVPCWLTEISNLYRMDSEGRYVRRLAVDQVHTIYPHYSTMVD